MPTTKDDLLAVANTTALELGRPPYTRRALDNWTEDGVLERAKPVGQKRGVNPSWYYSDEAKNTVRMIVIFKSLGATRNSQLRVCLWLFGQNYEHKLISEGVRSEFIRLVIRDHRRHPLGYDYRFKKDLSDVERDKYKNQIPPSDSDLAAAGFNLSPNILLPILSWIYRGAGDDEHPLRTISDELSRITQLPSELFAELFGILNIGGAFGLPDETGNSGQEVLGRITEEDLMFAREMILFGYLGLVALELLLGIIHGSVENKSAIACRKVLESLLSPEWITLNMGLMTILAYHLRKSNKISG